METEDERSLKMEDIVDLSTYENVIVPSTMRSLYWKYFGFPADNFNNILTKKKIICVLCSGFITYNKNTTNLRTHLVAKHSDILVQLNEERKNFKKQKQKSARNENDGPPGKRSKKMKKTAATASSSSSTSILNSDQELTEIVRYSTETESTTATATTNNRKTTINEIDDGTGNNEASTVTIIHHSDRDFNDKTKIDNLRLKLPNNVVSIIEALQAADDSGNIVIDQDDDDDCDSDRSIIKGDSRVGGMTRIIQNNSDNKYAITTVDEVTTDPEFIEESDFQTYSVTLTSTNDDHDHSSASNSGTATNMSQSNNQMTSITSDDRIQIKNKKYTILNSNNRTDASTRDNNIANVIEMIIKDLLPTNIVEGKGFQNYVCGLNQNCIMPQKFEIDRNIKEIYQEKFSKVKNSLIEISNQHEFSISLEIWENCEQNTLLNIYFNYYDILQDQQQQQEEYITPDLLNVFYKTIELRQQDNINIINELLQKLFNEINMKNCSAAVINKCNDIVNQFLLKNEIPAIMCFETIISLCMEKIFKLPEISNVLLEVQNYVETHSDDVEEFASITISHKNPWSKLNLLIVFYDNVLWMDPDKFLIKVKCIKDTLLPLKVTLDTLTDEPIALCTLIKPFTTKLIEDHFSPSKNDNEIILEIKKLISDELKKYIETNAFYSEASFFDPRFQSFIGPKEIHNVTQNLCDKFKEDKVKEEKIKYLNDDNSINKRSSLKQFFNRSERTTNIGKNNFDAELTKYVSEANADLEQCPLTWWLECGYNYRQLKKISQKYFCVPCCITNIFRYNISEQIQIMNKRFCMNDIKIINQLWFLYYNKDLL